MATQTHVTLVDDIDGSVAVETIAFGLDGASYEIDLNDKNAKKLRDALANYVANGRQVGARPGRAKAVRSAKPAVSDRRRSRLDPAVRARIDDAPRSAGPESVALGTALGS